MSVIFSYLIQNPNFTTPALRTLTVNATVDGKQTGEYKEVVIWDSVYKRNPLLYLPLRDGKTRTETVVASALDGRKAIMLYDFKSQPYAAVRAANITADLVLNIDLNDGTSGGVEMGDPASASALVRVDKLPAERELVAIEKTSTGLWRVAGNQVLQAGELSMQVTGGQVFAVGLDDFGSAFQEGLTVVEGMRIRPSSMQGWLYIVTQDGTLPAAEPVWWAEEGENPPRLVGTARLQAVRYYQPIAHGPIHYELI